MKPGCTGLSGRRNCPAASRHRRAVPPPSPPRSARPLQSEPSGKSRASLSFLSLTGCLSNHSVEGQGFVSIDDGGFLALGDRPREFLLVADPLQLLERLV